MLGKLTIKGVPPYDGEYEIPTAYTNRELHRIKQISGVRAGELGEATLAGDISVLVALSAVILERTGKWPAINLDALWDANEGENFDVEQTQEVVDEDRPPDLRDESGTSGGSLSELVEQHSGNGNSSSSGSAGEEHGVSSQPIPSPIGLPGSEDSADFDPTISES